MVIKQKSSPNTHMGEVHWYADSFFGTMEFVCQDLLGMKEKPPIPDRGFLDPKCHSVMNLWEFFEERELENGMLGLELYADDSWHTCILALIETKIPYEKIVDDQTFIKIIEDFKSYARSRPLVDPEKREGALWTDEDIVRGYCEAEEKIAEECFPGLNELIRASLEEINGEEEVDPDEIKF